MERWALVSGLNGDADLYGQLQRDLKRQRGVAYLFVLGDVIGPDQDCNHLINRLQQPKPGDLQPHCIYGWWEDQLLASCGYRGEQRAQESRLEHGETFQRRLQQGVAAEHRPWLASLQYGFIELDCGLIHGSSVDVGDSLDESTSPLLLLDRLTRLDVNRLFTARSARQFRLELSGGQITSCVKDHSGEQSQEHVVPKRSVIGIGAGSEYCIYDPGSDHVSFQSASSNSRHLKQGFA